MNIYRDAFLESFVRRESLDAQLNQFSASVIADCLSFIAIEAVVLELKPLYYSFELQMITKCGHQITIGENELNAVENNNFTMLMSTYNMETGVIMHRGYIGCSIRIVDRARRIR